MDEQVRTGRGHALNESVLRGAVKALGPKASAFENEAVFLVVWKTMDRLHGDVNARNAASKTAAQGPKIGNAVGSVANDDSQDAAGQAKKSVGTSDLPNVQNLMSDYNQAETLASSLQKKLDDSTKSVDGVGGRTATPTPRHARVNRN